jgi:hypothetical protein
MKKYSLLLFSLVFLFSACKKTDLKVYDGDTNIYFSKAALVSSPFDSLLVTFAFQPQITDSLVKVPVQITGAPSDKDRAYKVAVDASSSTAKAGVHFEALPPTFTLPAGKVADSVRVKLLRTPDMLNDTFSLVLELQPNENFQAGMVDKIANATTGQKLSYTKFKILVTDVLSRPKLWLDTYFGTFTRKKLLLMSDLLGFPVDALNTTSTTISQVIYWAKYMQLYLNEKKAAGQTVYEDDGTTPMMMGPSVQ